MSIILTEAAARKIVELAARLRENGIRVKGVRLDSGNLERLAKGVRGILDEGGLHDTSIFASGNLDEYRIHELIAAAAPIDGFGIGTSLVTSADAPFLDAVYKLEEYAGKPRRKSSPGKATWPGRKQVYRYYDEAARFDHDVLTLESAPAPSAEPLLVAVMNNGRRLAAAESFRVIRERAASQLACLPDGFKALETADAHYGVQVAPALRKLAEDMHS